MATTKTARSPIEETLATLKEAKATVYVVAIGGVAGISLKGEKVLRRIATETGGRVFMPTTEGQLELVHNALADDVQNRYLITYTPANQAHDGKWREISVVTGVPEYRVKARPGYFAPEARTGASVTRVHGNRLERPDTSRSRPTTSKSSKTACAQKVETFHEASQPVSIVLALDASGSMRHRRSGCHRQRTRIHGRVATAGPARRHDVFRRRGPDSRPVDEPGRGERSHRRLQDRRRHGSV